MRFCVLSLACILLLSCAPRATHYALFERRLAAHDPKAADAVIEKEKERYGPNDRLLYFLDRGMSLAMAGQFEESNRHLDYAAELAEDLSTKSVTRQTAALLTNDTLLPYEGEDFERVLIHLVSALNYAQMNRLDDALVECRRMDTQINRINDRYRDKKNRYHEDGFAQYLAGMLYEARGQINDAFLSYRKAFEIYSHWEETYGVPVPKMIGGDLMRTVNALGLKEESKTYAALFPTVEWTPHPVARSGGEIVVISMHGRSPYKEDLLLDILMDKDMFASVMNTTLWQAHMGSGNIPFLPIGQLVRVAFPRYVHQKSKVQHAHISVSGSASFFTSSVLMDDITALATADLEDRINHIRTRAIARAAIKAMAVRKGSKNAASDVEGSGGFILGEGAEAPAAITEVADKRSWRTLPDEIHLTRIVVPPGEYQVAAQFIGASGQPLDATAPQRVVLHAGQQQFLVMRTVY